MEAWINFGRGPLFRFALAIMLLGVLRLFVLTLVSLVEGYRRSPDKVVNWREVLRQTRGWLIPVDRLFRSRPLYSTCSLLFHIGLIAVPIFLAAHLQLWKRAIGFAWPALPQAAANYLTLLAVAAALGLFAGRALDRGARGLSRVQDYLWPLFLAVPFVTGFLCANLPLRPQSYQFSMLVHVYSADLILIMVPFTRIAHCVLAPLSQCVTAVAWKLPRGAGDRVAATLGYAEQPTWLKNARLEPRSTQNSELEVSTK